MVCSKFTNACWSLALCVLLLPSGVRAEFPADLNRDGVVDAADLGALLGARGPCPFVFVVPVGNPGNDGELSGEGAGGFGPDRICGAVDYVYNIAKYEVTAGQYAEFLNAVATEDTYALYSTSMWTNGFGCQIERSGSAGSYSYSVADAWADRPVNYVAWGDAARFANWLHNGQPTGTQDLTTTEDGSYFLDGATSDSALLAVVREPDATWVIPSEDEWYKAAYHYNDGETGNYWAYPTSSDSVPSNQLAEPDPGNNATFYDGGLTIGAPYYRTEFGAHANSESPYGTFDQGGNVWEWNESIPYGSGRGRRGGSFYSGAASVEDYLHAAFRGASMHPTSDDRKVGFRVAEVTLFPSGGPEECPPDLTGDGVVDALDLGALLGAWGPSTLEMAVVPVGNPGNIGELSGEGAGSYGPDRICGAVDYEYHIGRYEVTAGQYAEFLNAVATEDTYALYRTNMESFGCRIERRGSAGGYRYSVAFDWADRPVVFVSWGDAARFANWLHNGQPRGAQDLTTTEDGSYFLNGATSDSALLAVVREPDATWVIPSEDEWYKAAYHYNDGMTGNYWDYPTSTDSVPSNDLIDPDPGNNATFDDGGLTIGGPYFRTEYGAHENSGSPYDTYDQGGNVFEWNDSILNGSFRGVVRGGMYHTGDSTMLAAYRYWAFPPMYETGVHGFRVAKVP